MQIFFTHIPKTAGTTFRNILINNNSKHHIDWLSKEKKIATPYDYPFNSKREMHALKSISGHHIRYSPEMKAAFPHARFIVFTRDPIDRLISLYHHVVRAGNADLVFEEWVGDGTSPSLSNYQTRFISGECNADLAISILENEYYFAGTSENFNKSMLLLSKMTGGDMEFHYQSKRVSGKSNNLFKNDQSNRRAIEILRENNSMDLIVNDYINNKLLNKYQDMYGEVTNSDISKFKSENEVFNFSKRNKLSFLTKKTIYFRPVMFMKNITSIFR